MGRNKQLITASVSPLTEKQLDAMVESKQLFSSRSDAVEKSIGMMFYAINNGSLGDCAKRYGIRVNRSHMVQAVAMEG